jgi:O-methyltransferase
MNNVQMCIEDIIENNINGDFIETGVWRGGTCIFMSGLLKAMNIKNKRVFVADSFEGLPPPDSKYPDDNGSKFHEYECLAVSLEEVKENFKKYDLLDDNVIFIKGFFEHSLKDAPIDKLSLLRLDGDMYSSTIQVLEQLYDKVEKGGYIIVDDYGLPGCKKAIDDFRRDRNITTELEVVDWSGVYWKKE